MMNAEAKAVIALLGLQPLPREGGWFRVAWRTRACSSIHFLLTPDNFSALHRLGADEIWHFYAGDPVDHVQLDPRKRRKAIRRIRLGPDVLGGDTPQLLVPAGVWQGARIVSGAVTRRPRQGKLRGWSLLGCTMAPPWREKDFELGHRAALARLFPAHATLVCTLTR